MPIEMRAQTAAMDEQITRIMAMFQTVVQKMDAKMEKIDTRMENMDAKKR